jgi:assimilatory nitrate reductase catalytic subunit
MNKLPSADISPGTVSTTCPYCGVGCGVKATVTDVAARTVSIAGDESHPANFGRLCVKGSSLGETVHMEGRLLYPEIRGERKSWDEALGHVAGEFSRVIALHGPGAVAFYVSGQLLTEDYYVANKLMKGFIGTANIDTNSRLCMSSSVAGHKRAFGSDTVPNCYEDFELSDLVVLVGSNTAWCHPILFQRLKAEKEKRSGMRIVVIDPRRTATCDIADLHLPVKAGEDVRLFNALLAYLSTHGVLDEKFIAEHTSGFDAALAAAKAQDNSIAHLARNTGVDALDLERFFSWFATTPKTLTLYSQGVNQSSAGSDKVNAILNCHLATGRIGKPGSGPFSLTGQPNAMGGREVGGLANMLAAHMEIENETHRARVQRFWSSPVIAEKTGLKAVDMFEAVHSGKIKAIWIMATNPVVSLPDADRVREALAKCELVVVSDCIDDTDTTRLAHVKLPALAWGEKSGTVTNSERRISRQRPFLPAPGEAKADWWIIAEVAKRMGWTSAFDFASASAVFREHAALSAHENDAAHGLRDFDIGAMQALSDADYDTLAPFHWPQRQGQAQGLSRLFADGKFFTASGRANFLALAPRGPVNLPDADFPFVLNTGRIRDQWHTMTRTGLTARLLQHIGEPFCAMHPDDAARLGIGAQDVVELESRWGLARARAQLTTDQTPGSVFMPMHWTGVLTSSSRVGAVVNPAVDPVSGQPENKHTPVRLRRFEAAWHGFVLSEAPRELPATAYAVAIRGEKFWRFELAGSEAPADRHELANELLREGKDAQALPAEALEYVDAARGVYRRALIVDGKLRVLCFLGPEAESLPERAWLAGLMGKELGALERRALLSGRAADPAADVGRIVCACFGVGEKTIRRAIATHNLDSVAAIGKCCKAGTNCGSCQPELKVILASCQAEASAAEKTSA